MTHLPVPVRLALRRLARRLTLGLFLEVWPVYAAVGIAAAAMTALVCRLFVPAADPYLSWLWLAPVAAIVPAWLVCRFRAYTPDQVAAIADSLSGGDGLLLATIERPGTEWTASGRLSRIADAPLPALRAFRRWPAVALSAACLAAVLLLPQRETAAAGSVLLANHIADDVAASVAELKGRQILTPAEEKALEEEIARLRKGAAARMDDSSWEAADAMKERLAADLAARRDAVVWAQESLARYAAAQAGGAADSPRASAAAAAELSDALAQLAKSGMLAGAPAEIADIASGRTSLPTDPEALARLADALGQYLGGRRGDLARAASGLTPGRFDPDEFQLGEGDGPDGDGDPGRGGVNRGRADAPLTWGEETKPFDRFKAQALPPGAAAGPDDWAPVVQLPGAPRSSPQAGTPSAGRTYGDTAGQEAWRRSLAPRHQRAVRTYFAGSGGTRPASGGTRPK
jgi:hypothetical protein